MKGVLILAHGSREKSTVETMEKIFEMAVRRFPGIPVQCAYMEFCDVNLEKGLDILYEAGVRDVRIVPYFLFAGMHIRKDIPDEIAAYLSKRKDVKISMGDTLGADPRLAEVLSDRIERALC